VVVAVVVAGVAALLPDIDEPGSTLGHRMPVVSTVLHSLFGHRGITHTVFFAFLAACAGWAVSGYLGMNPGTTATIVSLAVLSHIALDSLTPSGTEPLWPVLKLRLSGPIRTGTLAELPVALVLLALVWSVVKGAF
jgi:inner membrane protein